MMHLKDQVVGRCCLSKRRTGGYLLNNSSRCNSSLFSVLVAKKLDAHLFKVCACTFAFSDQATLSTEGQNPEA
jgi:hypothetical protein